MEKCTADFRFRIIIQAREPMSFHFVHVCKLVKGFCPTNYSFEFISVSFSLIFSGSHRSIILSSSIPLSWTGWTRGQYDKRRDISLFPLRFQQQRQVINMTSAVCPEFLYIDVYVVRTHNSVFFLYSVLSLVLIRKYIFRRGEGSNKSLFYIVIINKEFNSKWGYAPHCCSGSSPLVLYLYFSIQSVHIRLGIFQYSFHQQNVTGWLISESISFKRSLSGKRPWKISFFLSFSCWKEWSRKMRDRNEERNVEIETRKSPTSWLFSRQ